MLRILLICLLLLSGCCEPPIKHGKVIGKKFIPAHYEEYTTPRYNPIIKRFEFDNHTMFVPNKWTITLRDGERINTIEVPKETHDRLRTYDLYGYEHE